MADIIGFEESGAYVSLSTGNGFGPIQKAHVSFCTDYGWSSYDLYPRAVADVNGDGMADIVGFKESGTYVSPFDR